MYILDRDEFDQLLQQPLYKKACDTVNNTTSTALDLLRSTPWSQVPRCELLADLNTRTYCFASVSPMSPLHCGACGQNREVQFQIRLSGFRYDAAEFNHSWRFLNDDRGAKLGEVRPQTEQTYSSPSESQTSESQAPALCFDDGDDDSDTAPSESSYSEITPTDGDDIPGQVEEEFQCSVQRLALRPTLSFSAFNPWDFPDDTPSDDMYDDLICKDDLLTHSEWWRLASTMEDVSYEVNGATLLDVDELYHGFAPYSMHQLDAVPARLQAAQEFVQDPAIRRRWGHISRCPSYLVGRWCMHRLMAYHKMMHFKLRVVQRTEQMLLGLPLFVHHPEAYRSGAARFPPDIRQSLAYMVASDLDFVTSVMSEHLRLVQIGKGLAGMKD